MTKEEMQKAYEREALLPFFLLVEIRHIVHVTNCKTRKEI